MSQAEMSGSQRQGRKSDVAECHKSPLAQAITAGDLDAVQGLLADGEDVNGRGRGEPPLCTAVRLRRVDMVSVLLTHGASVDVKNSRGNTPLVPAAQKGYTDIMCLLLSHGADANSADELGNSVLFWSVKHRKISAVELLLRHGAQVQKSSPKRAVLHTAVYMGNNEVTRLLLARGDSVNTRDASQETPLFNAIRVDNMEIVSALLELGADVNVVNQDLRTPLHFCGANVHNNVELTELLLQHGAHVNALDRYRNSPLVLCLNNYILKPNYNMAKCMIRHGSDINYPNCVEAMQWTVKDNNFDAVQFAVKAGFRITRISWIRDFVAEGHEGAHRWIYGHDICEKEKLFVDFLKEWLRNAQPLTVLCRATIRERLMRTSPCSLYRTVRQLPLPETVKGFLMMEDDQ